LLVGVPDAGGLALLAEAARLGYLLEPRFIKSKSSLLVNHDLEITMFHRAFEQSILSRDTRSVGNSGAAI
jgi:hypothetical protein